MSMISSGTSNNLQSPKHITHTKHIVIERQACGPYEFENYVDMTETPLRSITNRGTWMLMLVPTYSTTIFIGRTTMSTYVIPFVIDMLLARDSIVSIFIPSSISLPASLFTGPVMHHPTTNSLVTLLARFHMMCITERAQRYLSDTQSDKSQSIHANSTNTLEDTCRASL